MKKGLLLILVMLLTIHIHGQQTLSGVQENRIKIPYNQSSIQVDLSPLNSGLHIASLIVSGKVYDSKQIIKD